MVLTIFWLVVALIIVYVIYVEMRRLKGLDQPKELTAEEKRQDEKSSERWSAVGAWLGGGLVAGLVLYKFWKTGEFPSRSELLK